MVAGISSSAPCGTGRCRRCRRKWCWEVVYIALDPNSVSHGCVTYRSRHFRSITSLEIVFYGHRKLMSTSTSIQGTSSPSALTGLQSGPGGRGAYKPALHLGQLPQEQLVSIQIRKLTVRCLSLMSASSVLTKSPATQELCRKVPGTTRGTILSSPGEISA